MSVPIALPPRCSRPPEPFIRTIIKRHCFYISSYRFFPLFPFFSLRLRFLPYFIYLYTRVYYIHTYIHKSIYIYIYCVSTARRRRIPQESNYVSKPVQFVAIHNVSKQDQQTEILNIKKILPDRSRKSH